MICVLAFYIFKLVAFTSSTSDAPIKVYWGNSLCAIYPFGFLNEPSIHVSPIHTGDCLTYAVILFSNTTTI